GRAQQHPRDVDQRLVRPQPRGLGIAFGRLSFGQGKGRGSRGSAPVLMVEVAPSTSHSPDGGSPRGNHLHSGTIARRDEGAADPMPDTDAILTRLGLDPSSMRDGDLEVRTPITGEPIARLTTSTAADVEAAVARAAAAFEVWRQVPAPRRGELVRLLGEELRREKDALGALVTLEAGKIVQEGLGEVQEMIDICDFAVGLSRQL